MTAWPVDQVERAAAPKARAGAAIGSARVSLALLLVLAFLPRIGFLARPFESDAGLYIYMGKVVATGGQYGTLYHDFYETKPPGVALFTGGLYKVFGDAWWPWVMVQLAMSLGAAMALAGIAGRAFCGAGFQPANSTQAESSHHERTTGMRSAAGVSTFLFAAVFLNLGPLAYRGFQLETVTTFVAAMGAWAGAKLIFASDTGVPPVRAARCPQNRSPNRQSPIRNPQFLPALMLGIFAGIAAMLKPTGGAVLGAFAIAMLLRRQWRAIAGAIFGFTIPAAVVAVWTWKAGLLDQMPGLWREISLYGAQTPIVWSEIALKWGMIGLICAFTFVVARRMGTRPLRIGDCGLRIENRRTAIDPSSSIRNPQSTIANVFLLSWLILECLGVAAQKRLYAYHFLPIVSPIALLFGAMFHNRIIKLPGLIAALAPALVLSLAWSFSDFKILATTGPAKLAESQFLLARAATTDRVVGDGIERLLMETGLRCGTRYAHLFYLANHDAAPAEYGGRFLSDLEKNKPEWAVFEAPETWRKHREFQAKDMPLFSERPARARSYLEMGEAIQRYIETHYAPVGEAGGRTIWRRLAHSKSNE